MTTSELKRMLKAGGCYFLKVGGEHETWYCPKTGKKIRVPRHQSKEIPTGTANKILKDAGLK
ncbi:MAG: type II toxin-antitoxin system HicA family toxin [Blautia sp.]|nr:type II toxin-antitoxin system HicA family toxin [Aeriscardovia sp.]MBQ1492933.1 type II toxin-antitoxin system HicA family toxin [Blautia sp.]